MVWSQIIKKLNKNGTVQLLGMSLKIMKTIHLGTRRITVLKVLSVDKGYYLE